MRDEVGLDEVRRAMRGDARAFASLYEDGFQRVWAFAGRRCTTREAAEALVEAILTHAAASLGSFTGAAPWPVWLGAVAAEVWAETCATPPVAVGTTA